MAKNEVKRPSAANAIADLILNFSSLRSMMGSCLNSITNFKKFDKIML